MRKEELNEFKEFIYGIEEEKQDLVNRFFASIKQRCLLSKVDNKKIKQDFMKALLYYHKKEYPLEDALALIDPIYLGGFYARTANNWFPLEDSGKIYPMSMEHGKMAIFRLSAYLKEDVVPEILQMALTFTIKRFPTFATTVKKGVFWHYLDTTKGHFSIYEEMEEPCQPLKVSRSGSSSFRVIYFQNRISVEFFHVLTDGKGGMVFLNALVCEYLRLLGVNISVKEGLWDINDTPTLKEVVNEFDMVEHSENASGLINKRSLQMNGKLTDTRPNQIIHFKMNYRDLKKASTKYNVTITAFVLSLMFIAIKSSIDHLKGDVTIQVPINMRKFYQSETVRNFTLYCGIRLDLQQITTLEEITKLVMEQLIAKGSKEKMGEMLTATNRLVNAIRFVPRIIKMPFANRLYGFLGDQAFTSTLSNIGLVKLPEEYNKYIDSMDFVLGTAPNNRAICGLITYNETSTLSISKTTKDPSFEDSIYRLLKEEEIDVKIEGSHVYGN